jgi:hypothetical protein
MDDEKRDESFQQRAVQVRLRLDIIFFSTKLRKKGKFPDLPLEKVEL